MLERINRVRESLVHQNIDALFITNQNNVSYLTGFAGLAPSEREGFLLITKTTAYLITFSTYYHMYQKGGDGFVTQCITLKKRLNHILGEIIQADTIKTVGFEPDSITVSELESLKKKLPISWLDTPTTAESLRKIKDEKELTAIRKAAKITDESFTFIRKKIKPGITERMLALEIEYYIKSHAHDIAFSPIVAFNANAAIPHYLSSCDPASPAGRQRLTTNSLILLDFGAKVDGYCSDMTRVVFTGTPNPKWVDIYKIVWEAQKKALSTIRVGMSASDADQISRDYIAQNGYTPYEHGLGHGVGLAIHELPKLRPGIKDVLEENMVVTVEPGIYLPGEAGVRIEDLVVLKSDGVEVLSKASKELTVI